MSEDMFDYRMGVPCSMEKRPGTRNQVNLHLIDAPRAAIEIERRYRSGPRL